MRYGGFVLAYHGCDQSVGEKVLAGDTDIVPSRVREMGSRLNI